MEAEKRAKLREDVPKPTVDDQLGLDQFEDFDDEDEDSGYYGSEKDRTVRSPTHPKVPELFGSHHPLMVESDEEI